MYPGERRGQAGVRRLTLDGRGGENMPEFLRKSVPDRPKARPHGRIPCQTGTSAACCQQSGEMIRLAAARGADQSCPSGTDARIESLESAQAAEVPSEGAARRDAPGSFAFTSPHPPRAGQLFVRDRFRDAVRGPCQSFFSGSLCRARAHLASEPRRTERRQAQGGVRFRHAAARPAGP